MTANPGSAQAAKFLVLAIRGDFRAHARPTTHANDSSHFIGANAPAGSLQREVPVDDPGLICAVGASAKNSRRAHRAMGIAQKHWPIPNACNSALRALRINPSVAYADIRSDQTPETQKPLLLAGALRKWRRERPPFNNPKKRNRSQSYSIFILIFNHLCTKQTKIHQ